MQQLRTKIISNNLNFRAISVFWVPILIYFMTSWKFRKARKPWLLGADLCCDQALAILQDRYNPFFSTQTCWYLWLEQGVLMCLVAFKLISKIIKAFFWSVMNRQSEFDWRASFLWEHQILTGLNGLTWTGSGSRKALMMILSNSWGKMLYLQVSYIWQSLQMMVVRWWQLTDYMQLKKPFLNLFMSLLSM